MNRASSATGWVKNPDGTLGWTWNPITGCLNNCSYCYARKLANGRLKSKYLGHGELYMKGLVDLDPFYPRFWPDRLDDPFLTDRNIFLKGQRRHTRGQRRIPRGIFVCDMGELFGDWVPREWQEEIHLTISLNPQHRFYLLTKQPQNLINFSPFPDNCWPGVTATDWESFYFGAVKYLPTIKAKVKYVSFEPLLDGMGKHIPGWITACLIDAGINWIIIGLQTPYSPKTAPKIEHVEEIVKAADKAGIPVFLKDNLKPLIASIGMLNGQWAAKEWVMCAYPVLRQEMPQ